MQFRTGPGGTESVHQGNRQEASGEFIFQTEFGELPWSMNLQLSLKRSTIATSHMLRSFQAPTPKAKLWKMHARTSGKLSSSFWKQTGPWSRPSLKTRLC